MLQHLRNRGGSGIPIHRHDGDQHQHRAEEGVEEELVTRIDAALAAPHADDQEHRDQAAFEEDVEQHDVERAEHAGDQRLQHQEGDHVLLDADLHRLEGCQDAERHQEGGQDDEQHRDAVDTHVVGNAGAEPGELLDHLEAGVLGIEINPDPKRKDEGESRRQQRDVADVAPRQFVVVFDHRDQDGTDERQEGDGREDRPAHQFTPPNIVQVTSAATPISIAKA